MSNTKIETGGSAFPEVFSDHDHKSNDQWVTDTYTSGGMTIRDYFAAKALQGLISIGPGGHNLPEYQQHNAAWAYGYADAMIAVRGK